MFQKKDKSGLSLPKTEKVCGYEIKKMPIAPYLTAIERLSGLPEELMNACFPGKSPSDVLEQLTSIDKDSFTELLAGAFMAAPRYIIGLVADLTGISGDALINDPGIGLDGLVEIIDKFIEVNRLGKCLSEALALKAKIMRLPKVI